MEKNESPEVDGAGGVRVDRPVRQHPVTLVCWACGAEKQGVVNRLPQFAFEVAGMANDCGWVGVMDLYHSRSLVFCSEVCRDSQKTKKGTFRLRPKVA